MASGYCYYRFHFQSEFFTWGCMPLPFRFFPISHSMNYCLEMQSFHASFSGVKTYRITQNCYAVA